MNEFDVYCVGALHCWPTISRMYLIICLLALHPIASQYFNFTTSLNLSQIFKNYEIGGQLQPSPHISGETKFFFYWDILFSNFSSNLYRTSNFQEYKLSLIHI